jgi:hypothetical protein
MFTCFEENRLIVRRKYTVIVYRIDRWALSAWSSLYEHEYGCVRLILLSQIKTTSRENWLTVGRERIEERITREITWMLLSEYIYVCVCQHKARWRTVYKNELSRMMRTTILVFLLLSFNDHASNVNERRRMQERFFSCLKKSHEDILIDLDDNWSNETFIKEKRLLNVHANGTISVFLYRLLFVWHEYDRCIFVLYILHWAETTDSSLRQYRKLIMYY